MKKILSFVISILIFCGCENVHTERVEVDLSSSSLSLPEKTLFILDKHCASCHTSSNQGGINYILDLNELINRGDVVSGIPNSSRLFLEVNSNQMPLSYALTNEEKQILEDWIISLGTPSPPNEGGNLPNSTFQEVKAILDSRCISCHTSSHQIPLTTYAEVYLTVWPGNAPASLLYDSVQSGRMPKTGPLLTSSEISKIQGWIQNGAQDN